MVLMLRLVPDQTLLFAFFGVKTSTKVICQMTGSFSDKRRRTALLPSNSVHAPAGSRGALKAGTFHSAPLEASVAGGAGPKGQIRGHQAIPSSTGIPAERQEKEAAERMETFREGG